MQGSGEFNAQVAQNGFEDVFLWMAVAEVLHEAFAPLAAEEGALTAGLIFHVLGVGVPVQLSRYCSQSRCEA